MANCSKAGFNRVGGPNVHPVLGRKVVIGQERRPVFHQDVHCLGILRSEIPHKAIACLFRLDFGLGQPNLVQPGFGLARNGRGAWLSAPAPNPAPSLSPVPAGNHSAAQSFSPRDRSHWRTHPAAVATRLPPLFRSALTHLVAVTRSANRRLPLDHPTNLLYLHSWRTSFDSC